MTHKIIPLGASLLLVIAVIALWLQGAIPQDVHYHNFADQREVWGIPNMMDVLSNALFCVFGAWGLWQLHMVRCMLTRAELVAWRIFFIGAFWVGFGSGYYHWEPTNVTLVWDRLPMTVAFMSLFAIVLMETVSMKIGTRALVPMLVLGAASVFYWDWTEQMGRGDLRPYALVQFVPIIIIPLLLWLRPSRYSHKRYYIYCLGLYVLAKLLEQFDVAVYDMLGGVVSGHSLKHMAAAMGVWVLVRYLEKRELIAPAS